MNAHTKFLLLFFLVNLGLSSFFIDLNHNWNTTSRALPAFNYFENGTFELGKYEYLTGDKALIGGKLYTDKSPVTTWMAMPFYAIVKAVGSPLSHSERDLKPLYAVGSWLFGSLAFTLIIWLMMSQQEPQPGRSPVWLLLPAMYGSMLFVFSGAWFSHLLAGLLILWAYILLKQRKHLLLAGILTGLAFATEFPLGIFIPLWALMIWIVERKFKPALWFGMGCIPGVVIILFYNWYFSGSPFTMLYNFEANPGFAAEFNKAGTLFGFALPQPKTFLQAIFGQYKGILFYTPVLVVCAWVLIRQWMQKELRPNLKRIFANYFTLPVLCFFLLIVSKSDSWWGGWTYGPRYLIPAVILLVFEGVRLLNRSKTPLLFFYLCCGFGLLSALLAKATVVHAIPSGEQWPVFGFLIKTFRSGNYNHNNLLTLWFGLKPLIAIGVWLLLFVLSMLQLQRWYVRTHT